MNTTNIRVGSAERITFRSNAAMRRQPTFTITAALAWKRNLHKQHSHYYPDRIRVEFYYDVGLVSTVINFVGITRTIDIMSYIANRLLISLLKNKSRIDDCSEVENLKSISIIKIAKHNARYTKEQALMYVLAELVSDEITAPQGNYSIVFDPSIWSYRNP